MPRVWLSLVVLLPLLLGGSPAVAELSAQAPPAAASTSAAARADVEAAMAVAEFLAVYPLVPAERERLRRLIAADYAGDVAANPGAYASVRQLAATAARVRRDPVQLAVLRGRVLQQYHAAVRAAPAAARDSIAAFVLRRNPVVATDGRLTVTRAHVEHMWAAQNVVLALAGRPASQNTALEQDVRETAAAFARAPVPAREALADAEAYHAQLARVAADPRRRVALAAEARRRLRTPADLPAATILIAQGTARTDGQAALAAFSARVDRLSGEFARVYGAKAGVAHGLRGGYGGEGSARP